MPETRGYPPPSAPSPPDDDPALVMYKALVRIATTPAFFSSEQALVDLARQALMDVEAIGDRRRAGRA